MKVESKLGKHFVRPLFLDYEVDLVLNRDIKSYIEISLKDSYAQKSVKVEMTYNLMKESVKALSLF